MFDDFLREVAALVPLGSYRVVQARRYRVAGAERALIAEEQGYVIVAGQTHEPTRVLGNWIDLRAVRIFVRCQASDRMEGLRKAIRARVEAMGAREVDVRIESAHRAHEGSLFPARLDSLALVQMYTFRRPTAERAAALLRASLECARDTVPPMTRGCEICQGSLPADLALCDGAPGYYCKKCQHEIADQHAWDMAEISTAQVHDGAACTSGIAAAVILGIGAGAVASQLLAGPFNLLHLVGWVLGGGLLGLGIMRGGFWARAV